VYADILGFSDLVMSMENHIDMLDGFYHSAMSRAELRKSFEEWSPDPLTRTFAAFHRTLDLRVSELVNVDPLQSIVFSDPAPPENARKSGVSILLFSFFRPNFAHVDNASRSSANIGLI